MFSAISSAAIRKTTMDQSPQAYRMSFGVGGLYLTESIELARLHNMGEPWAETLSRAHSVGIVSFPKFASRIRALREIANRVSTFDESEIDYFINEADRADRQAMLWLATCRSYRFVREYSIEIIQERFLSYRMDLPPETFDTLLADKAELNTDLEKLTASSRAKLRQVLFRMMREAGIVSEANRIIAAHFSPRLKALIAEKAPCDFGVFPGMTRVRARL